MKILIKLAAIALLGVVALLVASYFLIPPAADKAVNEGSLFAFGVPATIGSLKASPGVSNTSLGFTEYALQSPTGFDEPLLTIGNFNVGVGTRSIIGATKDVGAFVLEDVTLTVVQNATGNNLAQVLKHMSSLAGDGTASPDADPSDEGGGSPGPRLRVGKIKVQGVGARFKLSLLGQTFDQRVEIPAYEADFSSMMGEDGMTVSEVAGALVQDLKQRALASADGVVPASLLGVLEKTLDGGLDGGLGGAMGAAKGAALDAAQGKIDEGKDAAQKLINENKKKAEKAIGGVVDDATKGVEKEITKGLKGVFGGGK